MPAAAGRAEEPPRRGLAVRRPTTCRGSADLRLPRCRLGTPTCGPDALNVSNTDRSRWRLPRKRHPASNVTIVVRPAHPEAPGYDGTVRERLSRARDCSGGSKEGGGEDR